MATSAVYWKTQMANWFKVLANSPVLEMFSKSERWDYLRLQGLYIERGFLPTDLNKIREWMNDPSFDPDVWEKIRKTFSIEKEGRLYQAEADSKVTFSPVNNKKPLTEVPESSDHKKELIRLLKLYPSLYKNTRRSTEEEWVAKCKETVHTDEDLRNLEIAIENYIGEQKEKASEAGFTWAEQSKYFKNPLNWLDDWSFYIDLEKRNEPIPQNRPAHKRSSTPEPRSYAHHSDYSDIEFDENGQMTPEYVDRMIKEVRAEKAAGRRGY